MNLFSNIVNSALGWFTNGGARNAAVKWVSSTIANLIVGEDNKKYDVGQKDLPANADGIRLTTYGTVIPRISGTQLIAVNAPFWRGELIAEPFQTPNGTKYNYFMDLAYVLCVGEIDGVSRVWENGELRAEAGSAQAKLPGTLYVGNNTQLPDPTISAKEGAINTPAFRGVAYIVMPRHYLGNEVKLPEFKFEIHKSSGGPF